MQGAGAAGVGHLKGRVIPHVDRGAVQVHQVDILIPDAASVSGDLAAKHS